jgi:NitT/TauT family transport system permease protein
VKPSAGLQQVAIVLGLALLVQFANLPRNNVPRPSDTLAYLVSATSSGELIRALSLTLFEIGVSLTAATTLGLALAILLWKVRRLRRTLQPFLASIYAMPMIFFYPLLLVVFGISPTPIILVSIVVGVPPVALNGTTALDGVATAWTKVARSLRATTAQTYLKVLLPAAAPLTFTGIRLSTIYVTISVIAMEFITGSGGVGYRARYYYSSFHVVELYAYVVLVVLLTWALYATLTRIERNLRREVRA